MTLARIALIYGLGAWAGWGAPNGAERLIEAGHWKQARAIVEPRLRDTPTDPLANFLQSQIRNAFGDHESPLPLAEKAVALDGATAKYHRQVAEVLGVMAQHAGMVQQLLMARRFRKEIETALALDPRDAQALRDLMEFYLLAPGIAGGDETKAGATAQRIAAVDRCEGLLAQARLAAFHKHASETGDFFRKAAESCPERYQPHIALAQFDLGAIPPNREEAERQARAAIALEPGRSDAYTILAGVYAERGAWNELDSVLTAASTAVPDDATPLYRAADRMLVFGRDLPKAERYLRSYLSHDPEGNEPTAAEAHWKLGLVLEAEARGAEAAAEWRESARLDSNSPANRELKRLKSSRTGLIAETH